MDDVLVTRRVVFRHLAGCGAGLKRPSDSAGAGQNPPRPTAAHVALSGDLSEVSRGGKAVSQLSKLKSGKPLKASRSATPQPEEISW